MDAAALIAAYRARADDEIEPYFATDEELLRHASEAEREACARARLIWDDTSAFLTLTVVADQRDYLLDERIDRIENAAYVAAAGSTCALRLGDSDDLFDANHDSNRTGRPVRAARRGRILRLWPTPTAAHLGVVRIACYRFPLAAMEDPSDEPEIPYQHHTGLVDWMLHRVFSRPDADQKDDPRSTEALAMFTHRFGERPSADVQRRHDERRRVTTRYGGL